MLGPAVLHIFRIFKLANSNQVLSKFCCHIIMLFLYSYITFLLPLVFDVTVCLYKYFLFILLTCTVAERYRVYNYIHPFQMTKEEFDTSARDLLALNSVHFHNEFLLAIFAKCQLYYTSSSSSITSRTDSHHRHDDQAWTFTFVNFCFLFLFIFMRLKQITNNINRPNHLC